MFTSTTPGVAAAGSRIHRIATAVLAVVAALVLAPAAFAQTAPATPSSANARNWPRWQVEFHGGLLGESIGGSGTGGGDGFPAGTPFTTINGLPSRAVPSWVLGDGAALFDEVSQSLAASHGLAVPGITPLDPVTRLSGAVRKQTVAYGGRFSGDITSWLGAEVSVDRVEGSAMSAEVASGIEATRDSYKAAFDALLATIPHAGGSVTATATTFGGEAGFRTLATASVVLSVVRTSRVRVHVLLGGGQLMGSGGTRQARFEGGYRFRILDTFPIDERETVTISYTEKGSVPVGVVGFGTSIRLAGQSGLRFDARFVGSRNSTTTTVDTTSSRSTTAPTIAFPSITAPSLQFSSDPGVRTTLSGDSLQRVETHRGNSTDVWPQITIGYFVRF